MDKQYIRLLTKGVKYSGQVAQYTRTFKAKTHTPEMYGFLNAGGKVYYVPTSEAEIISKKEYFKAVLQGKKYDG